MSTPDVALAFYTIPCNMVRPGFPETEEPYDRILAITEADAPMPDISALTVASQNITRQDIKLPYRLAVAVRRYHRTFDAAGPEARSTSNCARFACAAAGIHVDWKEAFVPLDAAITPEQEWDEHVPLALGSIGVMGTLAMNSDVRDFNSRVTHACVGTGTPQVFQVTALGGYMGLRSQSEMMAYTRREAAAESFDPAELRLFVLPTIIPAIGDDHYELSFEHLAGI